MNIFPSHFNAVAAAVAAFSYNSYHPLSGVDAAMSMSLEVACLPESPEVCVGEVAMTSPSPGMICADPNDPDNCTVQYFGGYSWSYKFVEGFEEGTTDYGYDEINNAKTGLEVRVTVDDDKNTCDITVGTEKCIMCSAANCGDGDDISYDYTNLNNGKECEPLGPIFYPFGLDANPASKYIFHIHS